MAKTHTKIISTTRLAMISAVFVFAGLMATTTTVDAAQRQRIYNKNEFVNLCNAQQVKIICNKKSFSCSCDNERVVFFWLPPLNHVPKPVFALHQGPVAGDGGGGGGGRGGKP